MPNNYNILHKFVSATCNIHANIYAILAFILHFTMLADFMFVFHISAFFEYNHNNNNKQTKN